MPENVGLIEPSFQDAIAMIAASEELPEQLKRHWTTSMRQFAKAINRPLEVIPACYSAVRNDLANWHPAPSGLSQKTVANHRSNTKRALLHLSHEKGIPEYGAPLTADWEELRAQISDRLIRSRLSSIMRYCSANGISPEEVDETVLDRFVEYRNRCSKPADDAFRRLLVRAWNASVDSIPAWPKRRLVEPPVRSAVEIEWEEFPKGLRSDVDKYLKGLTEIRKSRTGRHIKPLRASTIRGRRAELQAAARMAVKIGIAIEKLDSLRALLKPKVTERILDAYWQKNGEKPKVYTIDLARRFVAISRETRCLSEKECEQLQGFWRRLNEERPPEGLTEENLAFLRKVLTPGVWGRVVKLPLAMMEEARRQRHAPVRAAVIAQKAVAIAIEAVAPVRLANLASIRLGTNLIKPDGPNSNYWLHFMPDDVKNNVRLQFVFKDYLTELIDEYVQDFWPTLLRGRREDYLFPGLRQGAKGKVSFSVEISKYICKATGLKMTVHQFRHEAAEYAKSDLTRAQGIRNGLMIVILALTQIRLKNFVALDIGKTFKDVNGSWWVCVLGNSTKNKRWVEKRIPNDFNRVIELYLNWARAILTRSSGQDNSLWISSRTGRRFTYKNLGTLISKITLETLGVDVSPHLFRTAAASTAAVKLPEYPHLASALLGQADPRIADDTTNAPQVCTSRAYMPIS